MDRPHRAGGAYLPLYRRRSRGTAQGEKVFIVTGRGGVYSGDNASRGFDFQEPYLRAVLGFIGLGDVTFIHVEGLKVSTEAAANGLARAAKRSGGSCPVRWPPEGRRRGPLLSMGQQSMQ